MGELLVFFMSRPHLPGPSSVICLFSRGPVNGPVIGPVIGLVIGPVIGAVIGPVIGPVFIN